jgi:hypothetical protein
LLVVPGAACLALGLETRRDKRWHTGGASSFVKVMNPSDKYVGSRVRLHHLMLGMSQGTLADNSGLTFQQVQKYEKGVNRISAKKAAW